ncbi:hypothetical protein ACTIVE_7761 [Actinomadura verrucosospora]|uniref:Uncharacterized protein n=1 Tax=Actinomadura verrucosospora TaxID=46165 RepID=A0A7D4AU49_ACTVE|nr:hypothetical protein ACTIVE_7761 [Actinomadura verrucosospora]
MAQDFGARWFGVLHGGACLAVGADEFVGVAGGADRGDAGARHHGEGCCDAGEASTMCQLFLEVGDAGIVLAGSVGVSARGRAVMAALRSWSVGHVVARRSLPVRVAVATALSFVMAVGDFEGHGVGLLPAGREGARGANLGSQRESRCSDSLRLCWTVPLGSFPCFRRWAAT